MGIVKWISIGFICIIIHISDRDHFKYIAYKKGYSLSQKFKRYESWDEIVEPFIIRQFAFVFGVSNSFIKGLISDNKPSKNMKQSLDKLNKSVEDIINIKQSKD